MNISGHGLFDLRFLDIGCGKGFTTRMLAEMTSHPENIYGYDLANERIEYAKKMNPSINYEVNDCVKSNVSLKFDGISVFDVFMFLREREEIDKAIKNVYNNLADNGVFLWYEPNEVSHFKQTSADSLGFSNKEMISFAENVGLKHIGEKHFYKNVKFPRRTISTYYLASKLDLWLLEFINKFYIGMNTINAHLFLKE